MTDQCALQQPDLVKSRVRGGNGPDRKKLPLFAPIGTLDDDALLELGQKASRLIQSLPEGYNDILNAERYAIAQACTLKAYFPPEYRQFLLQTVGNPSSEIPDEWDYDTYTQETSEFEEYISRYINPHFRARISVLPPGKVLDWHIDTNTSYACRAQIVLSGTQYFEINRKKKVHRQFMAPGQVWFCNTGYSHRVEVVGDEPRVSILVGCHFGAISESL